jgi:hypothetical protein
MGFAWVCWMLVHLLPLAVGAACIWLAYQAGRRRPVYRAPSTTAVLAHRECGEVTRLCTEIGASPGERGQGRQAAAVAGQVSTSSSLGQSLAVDVQPHHPAGRALPDSRRRTTREQLLADPLSGVHDLFGGCQ